LNHRLLAIFILIVTLPILLLGWFGVKTMQDEHEILRHRFTELINQKLKGLDERIAAVVSRYEKRILTLDTLTDFSEPAIRRIRRQRPEINYILVLDKQGKQLYPTLSYHSEDQREFVQRTRQFTLRYFSRRTKSKTKPRGPAVTQRWHYFQPPSGAAKPLQRQTARMKSSTSQSSPRVPQRIESRDRKMHGWNVWYWKNGINLIYTLRTRQGHLVAAEISRTKLLADIIAALPATPLRQHTATGSSMIRLVDAKGAAVYDWGRYKPATGEKPLAARVLSTPLNALRLDYFASDISGAEAADYLPLIFSTTGVLFVMLGLAYYFYRENNRALTTARNRVTFVNQVSHELKTPLTNIRMYAELLQESMEEADAKAKQRMQVIVSESQRLSRLINNVLNFARHQRNKLVLIKSEHSIDELISNVLQQCQPALTQKGFTIEFEPNAPSPVKADPDIVEQILHNLISNVEKYAASGKYLGISSHQEDGLVRIRINDHGPGIPKTDTEKIFNPFWRGNDSLTEGVSGTGIGLTISRELARLHGGELILSDHQQGAEFTLTLDCRSTTAENNGGGHDTKMRSR